MKVTRREFGALVAVGLVSGRFSARSAFMQSGAAAPTIEEVIDRIKRHLGVEWRAETVDTVKAGDPTRELTGIVTTASATVPVLREVVGHGANLVITSEPTFYSQVDGPAPPPGRGGLGRGSVSGGEVDQPADPIYSAKNALIEESGLVVFRLSDHWRLRRPDPFVLGLAATLGWSAGRSLDDASSYYIRPTTLEALAGDLKRALGARGGIRVVGDRGTAVRKVALLPGTTPITASLETLPTVDVVIAGEVREWESVEYARDVVYSGQPKGFVLLGRVLSEGPGMRRLAEWLETLVTEVPVRHVSAGDPYWRPES